MGFRIFLSVFALLGALVSPLKAANLSDEIIYFVMLDRFADGDMSNNMDVDRGNPLAFQGGDLVGLRAQLDEISDLGATMIWITPVALQIDMPQDYQGNSFYPHHGYWAKDLNGIDPRFGSEADLKALVDDAHQRGIKVILDVVYNHLGYGMEDDPVFAPWLRFGEECAGGDPVTLCLAGLPDLKTELSEVREYLFESQLGLAERVGLDGFRLDTVKHISHDFWQQHRLEARRRLGEDFFLIGEVWDADRFVARPYFANDEMDALFDFSFRDRVLKLMSGVYDAEKFGRYLIKRHDVAEGYWLAPFLSNHDMTMALAMFGGDREKLAMAATIMMTIEGPPVIPYGEEIGRSGGVWPDNRQVMAWGERDVLPGRGLGRDEELRGMFVDLIALRKERASLRAKEIEVVYSDRDVLIYSRGQDVLVAINRSDKPIKPELENIPSESLWVLAFSSAGNQTGEIDFLPARSVQVFVNAYGTYGN